MAAEGAGGANALAKVVGAVWPESKTRDALGMDRASLGLLRDEGGVLRLMTADGTPVYPLDQFERQNDGAVRVKPGLVPMLRALRSFDAWAVAVLLHTPTPELNDLTPLDWLRTGREPEAVERLGAVVAREWRAGSP